MKTTISVMVVVALGILGCDKSKDQQITPLIDSIPVSPSSALVAAPVVAADTQAVPVQEDYEVAAESAITTDNASQELDKLQKEIGQ